MRIKHWRRKEHARKMKRNSNTVIDPKFWESIWIDFIKDVASNMEVGK